jgi:hypothetical protein
MRAFLTSALTCGLSLIGACTIGSGSSDRDGGATLLDGGGSGGSGGGGAGGRGGGSGGSGGGGGGDAGMPPDPGTVTVRDPAPDFTMPGEYRCDGCPNANIADFELEVSGQTSLSFAGLVTGANGNGEFYLQSDQGQRIAGPIPTDSTGAYGFTVPLFCGTQLLKCVWSNDAGSYVAVVEIVSTDCVEADIRITLSWDDRGYDFELHLIREGGRINDGENDCTWTTCMGAGIDWGATGDASDNPRKDVDNTGTFGPENIFYPNPEDGLYTVMVEHWGGGFDDASGFVTINVLDRAPVVVPIANLPSHHVFTAATIEWPSRQITVIDGRYDCTSEWAGGCTAELP